jgi:hypothetical protein
MIIVRMTMISVTMCVAVMLLLLLLLYWLVCCS